MPRGHCFADHKGYNGSCTACACLYANRTLELDTFLTLYSAVNVLQEQRVENRKGVRFFGENHKVCRVWLWSHALKIDG